MQHTPKGEEAGKVQPVACARKWRASKQAATGAYVGGERKWECRTPAKRMNVANAARFGPSIRGWREVPAGK